MKSFECMLCPRKCRADRSKSTGFCKADNNIKIARAALHYWEEPCVSGKSGSGTVFFSHCTLKCVYCQNRKISTGGNGYYVTVEELSDIFIDLQNQGANNINLVTPTHYVPQIIRALDLAKENGLNIPILYNCGGYESVEAIKMLKGYIDIYMPDMKYFDDKYAVKYSAAPNYFNIASAAIKEMYSQTGGVELGENGIIKKGVIVRHLMLPHLLFDTKKIMDYLRKEYGDEIYISLMNQYTPTEAVSGIPELNQKLNPKHYEAMINYCIENNMENIFIQEGETASESFIPEFYGGTK